MVLLPRDRLEVTPGCRVEVLSGRHFPAFGAGDEGVVLRVDNEAQNCEVLFTGKSHGVPVALRHLRVVSRPEVTHRQDAINENLFGVGMHDEAYHHHHHHHEYPDLAREQTADGWSAIAGLVPGAVEAKVKTEASRYRSSSVTQARSSHSDVPRSSRSVHGTSSSAEVASLRQALEECVRAIGTCARALDAMKVDGNAFHISQVLYEAADAGMKALSSSSSSRSHTHCYSRSVSPGPSGRSYLCATPPRSNHYMDDGMVPSYTTASPYTPGRSSRSFVAPPPGPFGPPPPPVWGGGPCSAWHSVHVPAMGPPPPFGASHCCPPPAHMPFPRPPGSGHQCSTATFGTGPSAGPGLHATAVPYDCNGRAGGAQLTPPNLNGAVPGLTPPTALQATTVGAPPGTMVVTGPDLNRSGVPDALEKPGIVPTNLGNVVVTSDPKHNMEHSSSHHASTTTFATCSNPPPTIMPPTALPPTASGHSTPPLPPTHYPNHGNGFH
mmetsp:Transcript_51846/g.116916  ORF Transcript_51846/g.116916 Transcript_51846/m.116916 type:complete len:495 (+) Transcript_51846:39-1523(+)